LGQHCAPVHKADALPQDQHRRFVPIGGHLVYAARGTGTGISLGPAAPRPRPNGVYGVPDDSEAAAWFCDPPGFGTNAAADYDPAMLEAALGAPILALPATAAAFTCASPGLDGQFLIASWFAVRDAALREDSHTTRDNDTVEAACLDALRSGQLVLLYGLCKQPM
ncbi:MAG: hypothetical protein AAF337_13330, partial [Pseudomonadota bacterium]